jgi:hypothetical protein
MIKNFTLLLVAVLSSFVVSAQVVQAVSMAPRDSTGGFAAASQQSFSSDIARRSAVLYLKKTLATFEDSKRKTFSKNLDSLLVTRDFVPNNVYPEYLNQVSKSYSANLDVVNKNTLDNVAKLAQTSSLAKAFSVKKSAECFIDKTGGTFFQTKDADGFDITAFSLESLRSNPRYGLIDNYFQGYARIKKDMVYGFLNLCGEEVITAQYDLAERFNNGRALVKKFFWHFINLEGEESDVLENIVDAKAMKYGVSWAKFKNNKVALIDNNFDATKKPISQFYDDIEPFIGDLFRVRNGKMLGLIKIDGTSLLDVVYDKISISESNQWIIIETNKKLGMVDVEGNTRIKPSYDLIRSVSLNVDVPNNASTVIAKDAAGFRLIELNERKLSDVYTTIGNFNGFGLAQACKNFGDKGLKCGYISFDGAEVIPMQYDKVEDFGAHGVVSVTQNLTNCSKPVGNCQVDVVYDRFGRIVIDKTNPEAPVGIRYVVTDTLLASTLIAVKTLKPVDKDFETGYNLIDKGSYKRFTTESYKVVKRFDKSHLAFEKNGKWGLLDFFGKEAIKPNYTEIVCFSDGLYGVKYDNGKYGYVNKAEKVQVTFEYSEIRPFKNGLAIVSKGPNKFGMINKFNAKVAPCLFKDIKETANGYELTDSSNNIFAMNANGDCTSSNSAKFYDIIRKANH